MKKKSPSRKKKKLDSGIRIEVRDSTSVEMAMDRLIDVIDDYDTSIDLCPKEEEASENLFKLEDWVPEVRKAKAELEYQIALAQTGNLVRRTS